MTHTSNGNVNSTLYRLHQIMVTNLIQSGRFQPDRQCIHQYLLLCKCSHSLAPLQTQADHTWNGSQESRTLQGRRCVHLSGRKVCSIHCLVIWTTPRCLTYHQSIRPTLTLVSKPDPVWYVPGWQRMHAPEVVAPAPAMYGIKILIAPTYQHKHTHARARTQKRTLYLISNRHSEHNYNFRPEPVW